MKLLSKGEVQDRAALALSDPKVFLNFATYGSAGNYFFYTLLDNHPELFVFPMDIGRAPVDIYNFGARAPGEHLERLLTNNDRLFDTGTDRHPNNTLNKLGPNRDQAIKIDKGVFEDYLTTILEAVEFNFLNFSLALVMAHSFARGQFPLTKKFAINTHDFPRAYAVREGLGTGRFLGTCRHPLNMYLSVCNRRYNECMDDRRPDKSYLRPYFPTNVAHFRDFYTLLAKPDVRIALVPIEEVHASPENTMRMVAEYMGISYAGSMLESTMAGMAWGGSHYTRIHGFDRTLHRYVNASKTGWNDALAVLYCTLNYQRHMGYTKRTECSFSEKLRLRLLTFRYYGDRWRLFLHIVRRRSSIRGWLGELRALLKDLRVYTRARLYGENRSINRIAEIDRNTSFSSVIEVVAPLQEGSVEVQKRL